MKTPITYYGGKQQLAPVILGMIPAHRIYCEPFFGGGAVFFAKAPSFLEAINDNNDLLVTFYQQCRENFEALNAKIQNTLLSESLYNKAKNIWRNPGHRSKLDIAWAVWTVTNMSVMATPAGGWKRDNGTGGSHIGIGMANYRRQFTHEVKDRLAAVQIYCRDAIDVIVEKDTPESFFYVDPPYIGCEQKHYKGYKRKDFQQLLDVLKGIKGKFVLSHFMNKMLEEYVEASGWNVKSVSRILSLPNLLGYVRKKTEVLVYNYDIYPQLFD